MDAVVAGMRAIEEELRPHLLGGERDDFKHERHRLGILRRHVPKDMSQEKLEAYQRFSLKRYRMLTAKPTALAQALCVKEIGSKPPDTFVLVRGNPHVKGDKVEPGFPSVLPAVAVSAAKPSGEDLGPAPGAGRLAGQAGEPA